MLRFAVDPMKGRDLFLWAQLRGPLPARGSPRGRAN